MSGVLSWGMEPGLGNSVPASQLIQATPKGGSLASGSSHRKLTAEGCQAAAAFPAGGGISPLVLTGSLGKTQVCPLS